MNEQTGMEEYVVENITKLMLACEAKDEMKVRQLLLDPKINVADTDSTGKVALHYCAESGTKSIFELIYQDDPSQIDRRDEDGYTPLNFAVISGNLEIAEFILDNGVDPNHVDAEKHSLVHWATVCGHPEILELLLKRHALPATPDLHGAHALHYATQMCTGKEGEVGQKIFHILLKYGANSNCADLEERTPLLWAASSGSKEAIIALVQAGAEKDALDRDGLCALHCAASRGNSHVLSILLNLGLDRKPDQPDRSGYSPLFYAVTLGHVDCATLLLQSGANPNHQDRKLRTAAHCGAAKGQLSTLKVVHQNGGSFALQNHRGDLPLHEAVQSGSSDLVRWLLGLYSATVNSGNYEGRTGLHLAAANGNLNLCQIFCDAQADVNSLMLFRGSLATPLDLAVAKDHENIVKLLRKMGAEPASALPDQIKEQARQELIIKAEEGRNKREINGLNILTDSQVSSDGGRRLHSAQTQTRESTYRHRHHHHHKKSKDGRSSSRKRREEKQPPSSNESEIERRSQNSSSIIPRSTETETSNATKEKILDPGKLSPGVSDQEILNLSQNSGGSKGHRKPGQHLHFQLDANENVEMASQSGSSNSTNQAMDFEPGALGLVRSKKRGSARRYMEEKKIFQELANLKRMQVQYGSVQEDVLVRRLMESFIKQYQVKPGQFQFNTFNAWEKFLYDQLKLIYYEEQEKQEKTREKTGNVNSKFYKPPRLRNEHKVDQLMKTYGVAPIPIQFSPNLYKKK